MAGGSSVEAVAAPGAQQQPPAGTVRQQHPARLIWAMRPEVVPAVATPPSPINNAATLAARAIQGQRDRKRGRTMIAPRKTLGVLIIVKTAHRDPVYSRVRAKANPNQFLSLTDDLHK
jgi:hypothetical protein